MQSDRCTCIPPNLGNAPKNFGIGQLTQAFWTRKKADGSLGSPLRNYERSAKSRNLSTLFRLITQKLTQVRRMANYPNSNFG